MKLQRRQWVAGISAGASLIVLGITIAVVAAARSATILPGVYVGSVHVGGLTAPAAEEKIRQAAADMVPLGISIDGEDKEVTFDEVGIAVDAAASANLARSLGSGYNPFRTAWYRLKSRFRPITLEAVLTINQEKFDVFLDEEVKRYSVEARDASLDFIKGAWVTVSAQDGRTLDRDALRSSLLRITGQLLKEPIQLQTARQLPHISTTDAEAATGQAEVITQTPLILEADSETITVESQKIASWVEIIWDNEQSLALIRPNEDRVRTYIRGIGQKYNLDAVDARVDLRDGQLIVTQSSRQGKKLDENTAVTMVIAALLPSAERRVILPFIAKDPEVTSTTVAELGIKELIGKASTSYSGSPANRSHNIANGAKFLNGKLIKPGAEFSVVDSLGAIDDTTGYLPELVIKENRTIPEYGGGLCQVSTTLFRAVLNAGLKVTERTNHSYRVEYYERGVGPGLDATIYLPKPDLKFLNDTPGWILVENHVDTAKKEITFELYGTKDGRTSVISKPTITNVTQPPEPLYLDSPDLPRGQTKQIEKAHPGASTLVTYTVTRGGVVLHEQSFRSRYKAWQARYLVGTGGVPTPTPSPAETTQTPSLSPTTEPAATPTEPAVTAAP